MDSFFFNITDTKYKKEELFKAKEGYLNRVDISNGIVFLESKLVHYSQEVILKNLDRMLLFIMVKEGTFTLHDKLSGQKESVKKGEIALYVSSHQDMTLSMENSGNTDIFILCIADFFLKRYLSAGQNEIIDFLYHEIQKDVSLKIIDTQPIDALSLYIVEKILNVSSDERMQSIRAEHRVTEFMIHRFSLLDYFSEEIDTVSLELAAKAKAILLQNFISPPTIESLAHLCATNESKLKKVFKKVHQTTLHSYVQKLRLDEANILLKEEDLTIGQIAKKVGYKHQGHFSKLFFATYGVYPKALMKH